nr:odorant-binding protein 23 [Leptocybe invasa]
MQLALSMKALLVVLSFCVAVAYCHDGHNHSKIDEIGVVNSDIEECAQRYKIDKMALNELKKNKIFTGTPDTQCFAACILRKSGIMLADGTINRDFVESEIASECKNKVIAFGKDECEIAAKILACLTQKNIVVFAKE